MIQKQGSTDLEIFKPFFGRRGDGVWEIQAMASVPLKPKNAEDSDFYAVENDMFVAQPNIIGTIHSVLAKSIVPIVAHVPGETHLRCLGTGFFISCTGLLITAAHVITDPIDRRYGGVEIKLTSDTALCKVTELGAGIAHQPLPIIQPGLRGIGIAVGKSATAIGYAGMQDVELSMERSDMASGDFRFELHVSRGTVLERFPDNAECRQVPTPGACFSASMKLPAGMSGSPIFDDERLYVHGVVSKGWEDESGPSNHGYGSMLEHSLRIPIRFLDGKTLLDLFKEQEHGLPKFFIPDA
ncbi:hypothetical protein AK812_SmicGene45022 [Symbiodinium microadriaticum]|uniref:Uncharacterized protein n=1 Tax=Symbiodinium microadriaticum TaxID=2951 RepID=A0A1Q9BX16_SYMMI|nr:hypothetical protein AK812_SmicGene45022 [Symbiodinium microadriaticum]